MLNKLSTMLNKRSLVGKKSFSSQTKNFDAIIIGGGHNGLICSNYLA